MRTAIDTNILSSIWSRYAGAAMLADRVYVAGQEGGLIISAPVYAELLAHPSVPESALIQFLHETGIVLDVALESAVWRESGLRFARYARQRRAEKRLDHPRRILADFIIGAHALLRADRLMTLDQKHYKICFPELRLI